MRSLEKAGGGDRFGWPQMLRTLATGIWRRELTPVTACWMSSQETSLWGSG
jgi:hypothetical protein